MSSAYVQAIKVVNGVWSDKARFVIDRTDESVVFVEAEALSICWYACNGLKFVLCHSSADQHSSLLSYPSSSSYLEIKDSPALVETALGINVLGRGDDDSDDGHSAAK